MNLPSLSPIRLHLLLAGVLLAPSAWMLGTLPPLWKDVDAYIQVTAPPGLATILHYGPLYCLLARFPLFLGYAWETLRADTLSFPGPSFFTAPILCDTGVFLLVLAQHAALAGVSLWAITTISRSGPVRLLLALAAAANPLFYAFAHCVGSETLSLLLTLALAVATLRLVRPPGAAGWQAWAGFGVLLFLAILTRHINIVLVILLPAAFALAALFRAGPARRCLRQALLAGALGLVSLIAADLTARGLAGWHGLEYHSRAGVTFMWRLQFLSRLRAADRARLIDEVARRVESEEARRVLSVLRSEPPPGRRPDVLALLEKFHQALPGHAENQLGKTLNEVTSAFLFPPAPLFLTFVREDFLRYHGLAVTAPVRQLFRATAYYYGRTRSMPQAAGLSTFRDRDAAAILKMFRRHHYLSWGKAISLRVVLGGGLIALTTILLLRRTPAARADAACALAFVLSGEAVLLGTCFLTEFQPRFVLPLWTFTLFAAALLLSHLLETG